eukprot:777688-Amphidinium_carterae.1
MSKALLWNWKSEYLSVPASPSAVSGPTSNVRQFHVPILKASERSAFSSGTSGGCRLVWRRKSLTRRLNACCH